MGKTQKITIPYCPRPLQREIHDNLQRFNVLVCHRRFGKSVFAINELVRDVLTCKLSKPRGAYIAPLYRQAKNVIWDYLKEYTRVIPGVTYNESELRADFPNGGRVQLFGADNADTLRGIYLDSVVMDEYAQMSPRAWGEVIRPALSDRKGKAIFIGTPLGHNSFFDLYEKAKTLPGWYVAMYKASDTGIVDEEELAAAAREMTEDEYAQEYECSWSAAVKGAYYAKEIALCEKQERITSVPWNAGMPVHTSWDLGVSTGNETAIWFWQQAGQEIHMIDYYEANNEGLQHYIDVIKSKPYHYGDHYAPHDIEARELTSGRSRKDTAYEMGIYYVVLPLAAIADGIHAAQMLFSRVYFDEVKCSRGLDCLRNYRRAFNDKTQAFIPRPLHDWSSNGADSFRYFAMAHEDHHDSIAPITVNTDI